MKCVICHETMDPVNLSYGTHPNCDMRLQSPDPDDEDPFATMLKNEIVDMVRWADTQNPRSSQTLIGPSEIGAVCDRRIGYRIADVPAHNKGFDPWPAIVGTAVHSWLERAVGSWMESHFQTDWLTESTLMIKDFVEGHADLYSKTHRSVIDYKTVGPDMAKKIRKNGPPVGYQIQAHVYGYGFVQHGYPVDKVCLMFLPRAGWLKDSWVWCAPYDHEMAEGAMGRIRLIAQQVLDLNVLTHGNEHRWEQIEGTPSNDCGFCPWYNPGLPTEVGASTQGCPGR